MYLFYSLFRESGQVFKKYDQLLLLLLNHYLYHFCFVSNVISFFANQLLFIFFHLNLVFFLYSLRQKKPFRKISFTKQVSILFGRLVIENGVNIKKSLRRDFLVNMMPLENLLIIIRTFSKICCFFSLTFHH